MYTLFTHQYLWNKLWQCLDADGGNFEHLHWTQNSRTSLISILLLYKYSSYDYRVIFFMSKSVYIILGHSVYVVFFMVCLLCISVKSLYITNLAHSFFSCMFISILYIFQAATCPSSGELIVSIRHLVYVTLYRWPFSVQVWTSSSKPAHQTVIYTEWHIPDVVLIQLILLMMGTWLPETCREWK